jgi:HK97 family phage portal protein
VGFFDWLGPTSLTKRRGWDALPSPVVERKSYPYIDDHRAVIISPLVSGPGTTDLLYGRHGDGNSAVFACLTLIATALCEPPLKPYRVKAGERVELDDQPIGDLLARPNPHMTLRTLLGYVSNCEHVDGNAYWRKLRAGNDLTGNVVELWPISPTRIEPRTQSGSGDFISYYRYYKRPGQYDDIDPVNIVHFRMGLDDRDHRLGCSPLKRLAREISSDEQATRYADRLLSNLSIPGLAAEFDKEAPMLNQAQADELKVRIQAAYGGDNVGSVGIGAPGMKLSQLGFSPEQMDLRVLHQVPEERIAAVLGVPAAVVGLGAGLEHSIYNNVRQAEEHFTERKLGSMWADIADTLTLQLLPDFTSDRSVRLEFDTDDVRALSEDQDAMAKRLDILVKAGILTKDEARAEIGRDPLPEQPPQPALPVPAPTEQRSRPVLIRTLPQRAIKAPDDLAGEYEDLRDDKLPDWEADLRAFLAAQLGRVNAALRAGGDTAEALVVEGEAALLGDVLAPLQSVLLSDVHALVLAELGIAFDLDDPATRGYLRAAGSNIVGITDTTREAVRAALVEGQRAGEGIDQLARRLRDLPAFNDRRARTVARTELGHASNLAAIANYRASGVVVGVRVFDGDYDGACQAMNGRVFSLGQEPATLQHPNCRRAFAPIVDAAELERSA